MDNKQKLQAGLAQMGLELPPARQLLLLEYLALLKKWNGTYNLTALRGEQEMISHHLLDSLTLLPYTAGAKSLIDVGSGGGMPGIPAAVCRPDLAVTLCDANSKKTAFLRQTAIELGLDNVEVVCGRIENLQDRRADIVTSRAFAELADFVSLTRHLVAPGGRWAAMKGVYPYEEIEQLPEDIEIIQTDALAVPMLDAERHMVVMKPKAV